MIIGPVLLTVALDLLTSAEHSLVAQWLDSVPLLAWISNALGQLIPYAIVTIVFTFMYAFTPNTRVEFRPALIGGVTAGIIWALVGKAFAAFIVYSSQMIVVYAGFAIVLTTLIWVYLSWLILLIGAQLAFYVQFPQYLRHGHEPKALTGSAREQIGLSVMYLIGRDYQTGKIHWTAASLAAELDLTSAALAPVLECLEESGLIVTAESERLLPGRAPEGITLVAVIDAVRTSKTGGTILAGREVASAGRVMTEIDAAMRQKLGSRSLKDFIATN
jgi:membrane protein